MIPQTDDTSRPGQGIAWRIGPAVLTIGIGVLLLLDNLGLRIGFLLRHNAWATIIVAVAVVPLGRAWELYRTRGRLDAETWRSLLAAVTIALVGVMFLLPLDWATWWPLFVIMGGLFALVRRAPAARNSVGVAGGDRDSTLSR